MNGNADFVMCSLYITPFRYKIVDFGVNYIRASNSFLVPRPKRELFRWYSIFQSLGHRVWILYASFVIFTLISLMLCRYLFIKIIKPQKQPGGNLSKIIFELVSLAIGGNNITRFQIPGYGFILTIWAIFGLFMSMMFSCNLETVLTFPHYEKALNTPEEFFSSKLNFSLMFDIDIKSVFYSEYRARVENKIEMVEREFIGKVVTKLKDRQHAIFVLLLDQFPITPALPLNFLPHNVLLDMKLMDGRFMRGTVAPVYRKNSPFKRRFEEILMQLIDSGLFEQIKNHEIHKIYSNVWNSVRSGNQRTRSVDNLTLNQMHGIFLILFYGLGISFIVFIFEILIQKIYCIV